MTIKQINEMNKKNGWIEKTVSLPESDTYVEMSMCSWSSTDANNQEDSGVTTGVVYQDGTTLNRNTKFPLYFVDELKLYESNVPRREYFNSDKEQKREEKKWRQKCEEYLDTPIAKGWYRLCYYDGDSYTDDVDEHYVLAWRPINNDNFIFKKVR